MSEDRAGIGVGFRFFFFGRDAPLLNAVSVTGKNMHLFLVVIGQWGAYRSLPPICDQTGAEVVYFVTRARVIVGRLCHLGR